MSPSGAARLTTGRALRAMAALVGILVASLALATAAGSVSIDFGAALADPTSTDGVILFRARLPRVLLGAAVGGSLGAAGAALQTLFRNALASPDVIGVSGGAAVGGVLALALGVGEFAGGWFWLALAGFGGALATTLLVVRLATVRGRLNPYDLLLVGVVANTLAGAFVLFVSSILDFYRAHGVMFWLAGSLAQHRWTVVGGVALWSVVGLAALALQARSLNLLALGEESASQLGVEVEGLRLRTFAICAMLVGAAVSVSGLIGFVGLIVPHLLRLMLGPDLRLLVPAAFLGGAAFLVLADLGARVVLAPTEIPVGVVTALAGAPFFIWLLRARGASVRGDMG